VSQFEPTDKMQNVETVIRDPLRFKLKLDIGDQAFSSLRLKKYLLDSVDAANGAATGFVVAKSSLVASTFFAPSGFLGALGIGTAATPVGWAIGAGIAGAGLSLIIGKRFIRSSSGRVKQIPDFINTPMDVLATGLFEMIGTLGVKIAEIDGDFVQEERDFINSYFVGEWGYDPLFVQQGLKLIEEHSKEHTIKEISEQLARFKKTSPDCNYRSMSEEIIRFINGIAQTDGSIDEREEMAIARVESIFEDVNSFTTTLSETAKTGAAQISDFGKSTLSGLGSGLKRTKKGWQRMKTRFSDDSEHQHQTLVTFGSQDEALNWESLGDSVMGGQSDGAVVSSEEGYGRFYGTVRLDNGGGFASAKADLPETLDATDWAGIELLARGDGKTYKVGLRTSTDRRSIVYQHSFTPDTEQWSRIQLPFSDFIPTWRGKTVTDAEPLNIGHLASVSLFVSGRQAGEFSLRMEDWRLF
jgi:hypothetical protein